MANLELDEALKQYQKLGRWLQPRKLVLDGDVSLHTANRDGESRQN
jgi:hypothetical protein